MKLTSILNNIISEVGEGSAKPYSYSVEDNVFRGSSKPFSCNGTLKKRTN